MSVNSAPRGKQSVAITQELVQRVAAYITQGGGTGVGLYPAQNDTFAFPDDCDATHPWNCDFPLPSNFQTMLSARLTWKLRAYRTYSTLTLANTGNASVDHTHGMGHTHSHSHTWHITGASGLGTADMLALPSPFTAVESNNSVNQDIGTTTDATASSAANTGGQSQTHVHSVSGTTTLGIQEDTPPVAPAITVTIDGTDQTAALGGPFNTDEIELDIRRFVGKAAGALHLVSLQPNQRCRVHGILKLAYTVSPSLN